MSAPTAAGGLPRTLTTTEVWAGGWVVFTFVLYGAATTAPLGVGAIALWVPLGLIGMAIVRQVGVLASRWPDVVGGTGGYAARLLPDSPFLARYLGFAYFTGWAILPGALAALVATEISHHAGDAAWIGRGGVISVVGIVLTLLPFVLVLSGPRTATVMQAIYGLPVLGLSLLFVAHGSLVTISTQGIGAIATAALALPADEWWRWGIFVAYSTLGFEAAAVYMGEAKDVPRALRWFKPAALAIPVVATAAALTFTGLAPAGPDLFIVLATIATTLWGPTLGPLAGGYILVGSSVLGAVAAASIATRTLHQLARSGLAYDALGEVQHGVPGAAAVATMGTAIIYSLFGTLTDTLLVSATVWLAIWPTFHIVVWLRRDLDIPFARFALPMAALEAAILVGAALTWRVGPVLIGLTLPLGIMAGSLAASRMNLRLVARLARRLIRPPHAPDGVGGQIAALVVVITLAIVATATLRTRLETGSRELLVATASFIFGSAAVALAGYTIIPQFAALLEARAATQAAAAALAKQRDEQARINAELAATNARLRRFVSIVSHEFRTPLTGLMGFSDLLRSRTDLPAEAREFVGYISADAERLARLVNEILDLDRMMSGRVTLRSDEVDLNATVRSVLDRIALTSPDHRLALDADPTLPPLRADGDRITQVVTNLVSNAVKFTPAGGRVKVRIRRHGPLVHTTVTDSGPGLPADMLEEVFEPFARVESAATAGIGGSGLGLTIAREIVRMHGGRIWAENQEGGGAAFHFTLPLGEDTMTAAAMKSVAKRTPGSSFAIDRRQT